MSLHLWVRASTQRELTLANSLPSVNSAPPARVACGDGVWAQHFLYSGSPPSCISLYQGEQPRLSTETLLHKELSNCWGIFKPCLQAQTLLTSPKGCVLHTVPSQELDKAATFLIAHLTTHTKVITVWFNPFLNLWVWSLINQVIRLWNQEGNW